MWSVKLTDPQRDALLAVIERETDARDALVGAREALDLARWDDLPEATLPWVEVSALADAQGIDEADVVWDLAHGLPARVGSALGRPQRAEGAAGRSLARPNPEP